MLGEVLGGKGPQLLVVMAVSVDVVAVAAPRW